MPEVQGQVIVQMTDLKEFKFLVQAALTRLRCKITGGLQGRYQQITASAFEVYPGKNHWNLEYNIVIDYELLAEGIQCKLTVSDDKNKWALPFCQKRLDLIKETLVGLSQREVAPTEASTLYGKAKWATEAELEAGGYICDHINQNSLLLAPWGESRVLSVPPRLTQQHTLVCGPTGTGKSSGLFIPNLIARFDISAIVTEAYPKGRTPELYSKTAGWRAASGQSIYYFSPGDLSSTRINPLDMVMKASENEKGTIAEYLSNLVVTNTTSPERSGDKIWEQMDASLLKWCILHVAAKATDPHTADDSMCNFGAVRAMLAWNEKRLVREMISSPSALAAQEFEGFYGHSSENFRHSVFSSLLSRMAIWTDENVATQMEKTDIDIEQLRHEKFTFYVASVARRSYYRPIASLVLNWLLDVVTEETLDYPCHLFLDEFTNFGYIPGIEELLSLVARKAGLALALGMQDYNQLEQLYKRTLSKIIVSQLGTRIFYRPRDIETATSISKVLGQETVINEDISDTGQLSKREQGRSLLAPSDLMTIDETEVVILLPSGDPVKCTRFTYETFPVPDGYPAPERPVHPVSERFSKARLDHEQKLAQYRKQQAPFADDDELAEELPPAEQVVEEESADDQADENRSEQPCQVVATDLATTTEEQREDDELEPDSVKVREEEEDEFYVP